MQRSQIYPCPRQRIRRIGLGQRQVGGYSGKAFQFGADGGDPVQIDLRQAAAGQGTAFDLRWQDA